MSIPTPHFLLFSDSSRDCRAVEERLGRWRFVLEAIDGSATMEAADQEVEVGGERLELLAVVQGLEALNQPSRVTLITPSRYVSRGMQYGLDDWRENDWRWERFGRMVRVKNHDLWQRVDCAMRYHHVECRTWRLHSPDSSSSPNEAAGSGIHHQPTPAENVSRVSRWKSLVAVVASSLAGLVRRAITGLLGAPSQENVVAPAA